ncbi:hypothetical protein J2S40_001659 [Nocardioides luteus]|uniref:Uncharacterized protein n=1 Tax=Nocardioides luteus TaxID=1844 RepID=A0ABQ5T024_9ACTN|nr:hypothetical protein [Nocardioides luteus]MDR7310601.1 hypothetical protein [Nocardioides luteus]GGR41834.1 hypothetical protein GCM10010197_03960 [Nocardioides luteus]GLJ69620.1 hypothetical protein GCM10017579_36560 [Nocardioides luteus]
MSAAKSWDLTWVATMLEGLPNVELHGISVDVEPTLPSVALKADASDERRPAVRLSIRPAGYTAAATLAESLHLSEHMTADTEDGYGLLVRHTWAGWEPAASSEVDVWVEITTTQRVWSEAVA